MRRSSVVSSQGRVGSSGRFLSTEGPKQAGTKGSWLLWLLGMEAKPGSGPEEAGEGRPGRVG